MPLIDLFTLAFLYTIRLFAGGVATGYYVSLWLLGFSSFLFLGLATIKRVAELCNVSQTGDKKVTRRGYTQKDLVVLQMMGIASSFVSGLVLALYVQNDMTSKVYANVKILWGIVPLILFWQCRLWLSATRGNIKGDPILYAVKDWVSWLIAFSLFTVLLMGHIRL